MYQLIYHVEVELHRIVHTILIQEHGIEKAAWWRVGVPEQVRLQCVSARESDPSPAEDPFCYTTFIHLKRILDSNWRATLPRLPKELAREKHAFLKGLEGLNAIRNRVMHPCKAMPPTEDDFLSVHAFISVARLEEWNLG